MFSVDTAIDTSDETARRRQTAVAQHQLSPNTRKSPEDHRFSLSLSQVAARHNYVDNENCVCLIRVTLKTAHCPLTCDVKMYFDSQV